MLPALFSHCTNKDATVSEVIASGMQQSLMPRLSSTAHRELEQVQQVIDAISLLHTTDRRSSSKGSLGLDRGAIYHLLKSQGQPNDERASFIWNNSAPPRVQMFMWLLVKGRISCHTGSMCYKTLYARFVIKKMRHRST